MQWAAVLVWSSARVLLERILTKSLDAPSLEAWIKRTKQARSRYKQAASALKEMRQMYGEDQSWFHWSLLSLSQLALSGSLNRLTLLC